jgi:hypothetical protein
VRRARPALPVVAAAALAALGGAGCLRVPDAVRAEFVPQAGAANHYRKPHASSPTPARAERGAAPSRGGGS